MKKIPFIQFTLAAFIVLTFSNCATIFSKSAYPVSINTNPSGADISITNKKGKEIYKGITPATVKLKSGAGYFSKAEYKVKLSSKGYSEKIVPVTFNLNGWYFGNLFIGGPLGLLIIDPLTGAMWRTETKSISESLVGPTSATLQEPSLKIININDVPTTLKAHLVRVK